MAVTSIAQIGIAGSPTRPAHSGQRTERPGECGIADQAFLGESCVSHMKLTLPIRFRIRVKKTSTAR